MARHKNQAWWSRWPIVVAVFAIVVASGAYAGIYVTRAGQATADPCTDGTRTVTVGADPTAAWWMSDLAATYNAAHHHISSLCVLLDVSPLPLDKAMQALQATPYPGGGAPPEIWLPTSTTSVELLRDRPTSKAVLPARVPSIASSPLVLAAPAEALAAIRAPQGSALQFSDYLNLARDDAGWSRLGRPGWGPVRFSSADPHGSDTGVSLIQAVATTSAGVPLDQTTARTFSDTAALAGLLSFVRVLARTSNDPDQLFDAAGDMASGTAIIKSFGLIVATEQQVYRYNQVGGRVPLKAAYPFGGTYASNFPVVTLNGSWVDGFAHQAGADFTTWARSAQAQAKLAEYGLRRPEGDLGRLDAARNGLATGRIAPKPASPEGVSTARGLWNLFNRPTSVLVVCDTSGSMAEPVPGTGKSRLDLVRQAMSRALSAFQPQDHVGLWEFSTRLAGDTDYRTVVPLGRMAALVGNQTRGQALRAGFSTLRPHAATGLYDTVLASYRYAKQNYLDGGFNTVVLLTDGQNEDAGGISLATLMAQLTRLRDPHLPVHLIILAVGDQTDPATLTKISKAADGATFVSKDLSNIVQLFLTAQVTLANANG
jgi:Ca-activated chloride channel family protein